MSDIRNNELRRLDLTVLLVFLGLLRRRKATEVAADLGLTQSGVSQALKRLRDIFGDELFLRRPFGFEPTSVALALEAPVAAAVESLRAALSGVRPFDPAAAEGVLRLAAPDAEQAEFVPSLVRRLSLEAPGLRLSVVPFARRAALQALAEGSVELALGFFWDVPSSVVALPLFEQGYAVLGRPEVLGEGPLTLQTYLAQPHVLVSPAGDLEGVVDHALAAQGLRRHVVAAVPQFFPALAAAAEAGCLATLPDRLAARHGPAFGLRLRLPPLELRRFTVSALRHRRHEHDGRLLWIVETLRAASQTERGG